MRFHRPARRIALGLGAAGIALGSGGLAIAATALIQPAGALSVQVPAVAVREQNVNAAGRIRVALPKTSVGVNGSVSVNNLPLNSAGRLQTQNGTGEPHFVVSGQDGITAPVDIVNVQNSSGTLTALEVNSASTSGGAYPANVARVTVLVDGHVAMTQTTGGGCCWMSTPDWGWDFSGGSPSYGLGFYYDPRTPVSYHHSLVIQVIPYQSSVDASWKVTYTTAS